MKYLLKLTAALLFLATSAVAGIPDPRDHHYEFAHRVLVEAMSADGFMATLDKKKEAYLKGLWRDAEKKAKDGKRVSSKGLEYRIFEVDGGRKVVIVILPEAEVMAEAFMVGALFEKGKMVGIAYTLEKGANRLVLGGWSDGRHLNFGDGPENDPEKFRDAILEKNK